MRAGSRPTHKRPRGKYGGRRCRHEHRSLEYQEDVTKGGYPHTRMHYKCFWCAHKWTVDVPDTED